MNERRLLLTIKEARAILGPHLFGRDLTYRLARKYGIRAGRRFLIPQHVIQEILEGRIKVV